MADTGFERIKTSLEAAARLHQSGQRTRAIEIYRALLAEAPRLPPLLNLLGLALIQEGNVEEGLRRLEKAVSLAPDYADAWLNLAFARYEAEDRDGAIAAYRHLLKLQPNHPQGLLSLASLAGESDSSETIMLLRRAIQSAPDRALPWLRLRRVYTVLDNRAGIAEADREIARIGLKTPEELVEAGNAALLDRRYDVAISHFRRATQMQPGLGAAALGLGEALLKNLEYEAAVRELTRAAELAPRRSSPWIALGSAYLAMEKPQSAATALREALKREENDIARHMLAIAEGSVSVVPDGYIKWLYASRSTSYDRVMQQLGSGLPAEIAGLLRRLHPAPFRNALELGCGTGLLSAEIGPLARRLVGLDVSPAMLAHARRTRRYQDHVEQEAVAYLSGTEERFDLVVSVDMLIHVGDLKPLFAQVVRHLDPDGLFVITTQRDPNTKLPPQHFRLLPTGNFVHEHEYVESVAAEVGLRKVHTQEVALPRQESEPAQGSLFAFAPEPRN